MTEVYTLIAGRQIYKNGVRFLSIGREGDTSPTEADRMARLIVLLLNQSYRGVEGASK